MLSLHTIHSAPGSKKKRQRIGRGGKRGNYSGKGHKGQNARSGVSGLKRLGMRQLIEQTPKMGGFKSLVKRPEILNLKDLESKIKAGDKINPQMLKEKGFVREIKNGVKILGNGEIKIKIEVEGCAVSKSAKEKIEKAGGVVKE